MESARGDPTDHHQMFGTPEPAIFISMGNYACSQPFANPRQSFQLLGRGSVDINKVLARNFRTYRNRSGWAVSLSGSTGKLAAGDGSD